MYFENILLFGIFILLFFDIYIGNIFYNNKISIIGILYYLSMFGIAIFTITCSYIDPTDEICIIERLAI